MTDMWTPPPPPPPAPRPASRRRGIIVGTSLVGAGVVAGAILGVSALSSAATISPSAISPSASAPSASTPSSASSAGSSWTGTEPGEHHGGGLDLSGKVTAVGSSSVTIKTSAGTTTYTVNANSDIDKNGEAVLKNLAVGDAVTFSVDSSSSTTIDKLHAGNEALDKPTGAPAGTAGG